jgi:hypothetical protein
VGEEVLSAPVAFTLDLREKYGRASNLRLSCVVDEVEYAVSDAWCVEGLLRLQERLHGDVRIRACVTCLLSDYSPAGYGLMGIRRHREARERYLAVRSKGD